MLLKSPGPVSQSILAAVPLKPPSNSKPTQHGLCKFRCSAKDSTDHNFPLKLPLQLPNTKWKFRDINPDVVKRSLNSLLSRTHDFVNEVASPLGKTGKAEVSNDVEHYDIQDMLVGEQMIPSEMPDGNLSLAAVVSIEQFSRMNGLTGRKMQKIFEALMSKPANNEARNFVEYCCFRFLSRDNSDIHPCLEDLGFQRLIFITMLAWEMPYRSEIDLSHKSLEETSLKTMLVREEAFVRIAPAVSGLADQATVHNLYRALASDKGGISFSTWSSYIHALLKVHNVRKCYEIAEVPLLPSEQILCVGSSRKQPVLKWENSMAWPGKLTLTDKALYFEPVGSSKNKRLMRLNISGDCADVKDTTVGFFEALQFDSAVSVSSGEKGSNPWVLEFIDLGGEMRRDVWHASISEVISFHKFIREYGPEEGDHSIFYVYGAHKGKERTVAGVIGSISRLQALQSIKKLLEDPLKLVQFSYLQYAPYGDIVYQTLALSYWGGPLITRSKGAHHQNSRSSQETSAMSNHIYNIDGSVYLRQWMKSPSWASSNSISFWRGATIKQGVVLSKNLVVGGTSLLEKAATTCRSKSKVVEKTQATIDAATLEGIPNNIDLFKELVLPVTIIARNFEKLRRWEEPLMTISILALMYTIIFRNLLSYVFPTALIIAAVGMLLLKGLKEQGRLGRSFGKVTIHDQPPSNTIQKIMALKNAMRDVESYLQNLNVTLLKIRAIILSGQPQVTREVALVLLASATILLVVPFKYVLVFFTFDLFTRELEFRKEMVLRFSKLLKDRWETVPAASVIVLPFANDEKGSTHQSKETDELVMQESSE